MMKKLTVLALSGTLLCAMSLPAMAAGKLPVSAPVPPTAVEALASAPDSVLYSGTVKEIVKNDKGAIEQICMTSDRYGEYVMNISPETVWIDSGNHTAFNPSELQQGERVYVFHSYAETRSLPPQTAAFAVVRNISMDASNAHHHHVEAVTVKDGKLTITTDQGSLLIYADGETGLSRYDGKAGLTLANIQAGDTIMAWYQAVAESYPGQTYADHLMLLPGEHSDTAEVQESPLTRAELVTLLYEKAGKPVVDRAMHYTDVTADAPYAEAVRWATSAKLIGGYGDGSFKPDETVSRQQMVTIMWRYAGHPTLMDYPGLTQFSDAAKISRFAQPAMAWAHQQKLITAVSDGVLDPLGTVTQKTAETMLNAITPRK